MKRPNLALTFAVLAVALAGRAAADEDIVDFARDVRPILSAACFKCHGPDEKSAKLDLRLDTADGALKTTSDRAAFVAGKPAESEALRRMTASDPDERMPPADSGKSLSEAQIAIVGRWVEQGARWSSHWAFTPPRRPALPQFSDAEATGWVRNPIDLFVLARLKQEGLSPSPEADKATLVRRLSLDLIGLPPTMAEVDAFWRTAERMRTNGRSSGCWSIRTTASAGAGTGSTRPAMPTRDGYEKDKLAAGLVLSRLGDGRLQPRPALRPVHHRTAGRRPAA